MSILALLPNATTAAPEFPIPDPTVCNQDDRVLSSDPCVGRIVKVRGGFQAPFCTAWLAANGALITAGHCVDQDPDDGGPQRPDGTLDIQEGDFVEFNVPLQQADGRPLFSDPTDQYPIIPSSIRFEFPGFVHTAVGGDWAVFACGPNPITGLRPHIAQNAFFRLTNQGPLPGEAVRVTGYGIDNTPPNRNQLQQTDAGPYLAEVGVLPAVIPHPIGLYHVYTVDGPGGASGSPVMWEARNRFAIGIHVAGGCFAEIDGTLGTSFESDPLESALQRFPGANTLYVDREPYPQFVITVKNGGIFYPFDRVAEAVHAAQPGGIVSIVKGSYPEPVTLAKQLTLKAPVGTVTLGQ
jgi:hypothetical protein